MATPKGVVTEVPSKMTAGVGRPNKFVQETLPEIAALGEGEAYWFECEDKKEANRLAGSFRHAGVVAQVRGSNLYLSRNGTD